MRWVAWAAALPLVARAGTITADEARCIVDGKTTIFFGDSLTRFCYYEFNTFLSTGAVRDHELGASSGDGRWSDDYDDWEEWTEEGICGAGGKHRRRIWMDLDETTRTEFYFINNVWYAEEDMDKDGDTSLADVAEVAKDAADVVEVLDNLLAFDDDVVGIYRTTACCGESHFGDNYNSLGTVTDGWVPAIEAQNAKATAMMEAAGVPVVDVYPFYNISSVDDYTFDSRHATVATCHVWTEMILRAIDRAQGTGCVADLGADYVPEFVFDRWPSPGPTPAPSAPTYAPSPAPSYMPSASPPTYRPTASPSAPCVDDVRWAKVGTPRKDCAWVAEYPGLRCDVVGANATAHEACRAACGCSSPPSPAPAGRRRRRRPPRRRADGALTAAPTAADDRRARGGAHGRARGGRDVADGGAAPSPTAAPLASPTARRPPRRASLLRRPRRRSRRRPRRRSRRRPPLRSRRRRRRRPGRRSPPPAQCPRTCFEETCDAWATKGSSCADLAYWGCDCAGCVCALDGTDGDATVVDKKQGAAPAPTAAAASSWSVESLESGGATRYYWVYAPDAADYTGMMLFFHGAGGGANVRRDYRVAEMADAYGFVGVVPVGSPGDDDEDGKGDDDYGYHWNVDVADGVDDVSFVHAVVAAVAEDYAVAADRPVIALGFSNGAGMSELLGCHSSYDLWVAHLGVHYRAESDWPSTCQSKYSDCPEWNAVGSEDWFLDTIGTDGVLAQFEASRDAAGCPEEAASRDGECYEYASCPSLGRLCVWDGVGHAITDATTEAAWTYLTGGGACASATAAPSSLPGSKKSSDAADAASLGAESLYALAAVLALLILAAVAYRLSRTKDSAPFAPPSPPPLPVEDVAAVAVREFAVEFDDTPTKACKKAFLGDDADAPAETPAAACLGEPLDTQVTTGSEIHPAEPASPGVAGWAKTLELGDGDAPEEPAGGRALDAALERASSLGDLDPEAPEGDAEAADGRDIAGDVAKALLDEEAAAD
ncbi:hypothetical protein JL720_856 [Aureococcus anophagefferens]|nr:hypothetical protein JL720_856 [Aureococcus anophagefferens]